MVCDLDTDTIVVELNKQAAAIMAEHDVPTVDLHSAITGKCGVVPQKTCFNMTGCFCPHCSGRPAGQGYDWLATSTIVPALTKLLPKAGSSSIKTDDKIAAVVRPKFSWDTLPVFFHSANASGPWNNAAIKAIARYPMATFEKDHAFGSGGVSETNGPAACRQIATIAGANTSTVYYLNSAIDWQFYSLHQLMEKHPEYRLKDGKGDDVVITAAKRWGFAPTVPDMAAAWIRDCMDATRNGCSGCRSYSSMPSVPRPGVTR